MYNELMTQERARECGDFKNKIWNGQNPFLFDVGFKSLIVHWLLE
jgi:hypothetical protein